MSSDDAKKRWLLENNVQNISASDEIYNFKREEQHDMLKARPWDKE